MDKKVRIFLTLSIIVGLLVALYFVSEGITRSTGYGVREDNTKAENIAKCLTNKNVTIYGSNYCPHCSQQKLIFGEAFKLINYVECSENADLCAGLEGVPAWNIKGKIYYGTKSLSELKALSGC